MAEKKHNPDYYYLNQLSTEQLEELLRVDSVSGKEKNDDLILYILEVIEKREQTSPTGRLPDVGKAWAEFKEYYAIPEGDGLSLYPTKREEEIFLNAREKDDFEVQRKPWRFMRHTFIAAAVITLIILSTVPAFGYSSIFQLIGEWTAEQFGFADAPRDNHHNSETEPPGGKNYTSLQDALIQYGIAEAVVPQSIPDGFQLEEIWVQEYAGTGNIEFSAPYAKGDDYIIITVIRHNGQTNSIYEKDEKEIAHYMAGNIEHYIFHNNNNVTVAWSVNSLECSISTTLPVDELEKMIDSIYEE